MKRFLVLALMITCAVYGQGREARGKGRGKERSPSMSRLFTHQGPSRNAPQQRKQPQKFSNRMKSQPMPKGDRASIPERSPQRDRASIPERGPQKDRASIPRGEIPRDRAGIPEQGPLRDRASLPEKETPRDRIPEREPDLRERIQQRGDRTERRQDRREERPRQEDRQERRKGRDWRGRGDDVRKNVHHHHPYWNHWFRHNFWDDHYYYPRYPYYGNYWRPITWGTVTGWLPWTAGVTYYYYDAGSVYSLTEPIVVTPFDYSQYEDNLNTRSAAEAKEDHWLPLGIYALTSSTREVPPNLFLQLALSKQGEIEGTLYNSTTDQLYPINGFVEEKTQRAVLQVSGVRHSPILETGLYNLTEEETAVQLHFSDGETQEWLLVRLEEEN